MLHPIILQAYLKNGPDLDGIAVSTSKGISNFNYVVISVLLAYGRSSPTGNIRLFSPMNVGTGHDEAVSQEVRDDTTMYFTSAFV